MSSGNCDVKAVEGIIKKWKNDREYVIEMLQDVQDEFRHIPKDALEVINRHTHVPVADLYHITTFYKAFSLEPRGKYEIQICLGTACHVKGAQRILEAFERELDIPEGSTTKDKLFSLKAVRCIGCCSIAPVITINEEIYGDFSAHKIKAALKKYK
jgi:NADH-quinone oxidoreductase subunit E